MNPEQISERNPWTVRTTMHRYARLSNVLHRRDDALALGTGDGLGAQDRADQWILGEVFKVPAVPQIARDLIPPPRTTLNPRAHASRASIAPASRARAGLKRFLEEVANLTRGPEDFLSQWNHGGHWSTRTRLPKFPDSIGVVTSGR